MAAQLAGLAPFADDRAGMWPDLARAPVLPKGDDGHPARAAAEAAFEGRMAIVEAIASFRSRMQRVVEGPAQGNDLSNPSPFD